MMQGSYLKWTAGCLLSLLCLPGIAASAGQKRPERQTVPLTAGELYTLYADKTWTWDTGGGRFIGDGRRMVAWVNDKGMQSLAEGSWSVDDNGQFCMRGLWSNKAGSARASTCFGHRKVGATIYQRRQPSGHWYVFKHARPRSGDEFNKLVASDTVSKKASDLKQVLMAEK